MVKRIDSLFQHVQDGIIDVHISADCVNINKNHFTTREGVTRDIKKVQKPSFKEDSNLIGSHGRTKLLTDADYKHGQQHSSKGDSNGLGNTCVVDLNCPDDEFIDLDKLIHIRFENDKVLKRDFKQIQEQVSEIQDAIGKHIELKQIIENILLDNFVESRPGVSENLKGSKRIKYGAEKKSYDQTKEQESNLPVKSTSLFYKRNPSTICDVVQKDQVEKQKDWKVNIKGFKLQKECLKVLQNFPIQDLNNLKGFLCDQLKKTSKDLYKWNSDLLKSVTDILGLAYLKGRNIAESLCQDEKSTDPPFTKETTSRQNHKQSFNTTGWGTGILILLIFGAATSNATTTGLDVRPITKVALDERIELQCKKANDGGTKWIGGPKNELLTFGMTVEQEYTNYLSLIDTNKTYNLVIENATWEFVNSSYNCHVGFIQDSTKRLSEYGYEVIPKVESLTVMQSKKSECLNETIEFKKVNPLPNCTTSLDENVQVEVTYLHKQWYGYYYAVTVGLVVKNCDGCNVTMHCYVGNEILNITFEQDRKAEPSPLGKDEESDSQTGLIVGLGVGVMAAVVTVVVIIVILYKRGICRGKTKRQRGRADKTDLDEAFPLQNNQPGEIIQSIAMA